jgi:tetratricopeptide (TPR) repeat protein
MSPTTRTTAFLTLLLAACAGTAGAGTKVFQADHVAPQMKSFDDEAERAMLRDPYEHARLGDMSRASGNLDQARAEDRAAAEGFAKFADKFTGSEWRLVFRSVAAERYFRGAEWAASASEAKKLIDDPLSNDTSRAIGARLAAGAWQQVAIAEMRAGKIEPLRELNALQRKGQEPKPRVPADPWKRFVEYTDLYESLWKLDPQAKPDSTGRAGIDPAGMALFAARVEFAYDNMEDARRRFDAVISAWASRADILETAVPLYLETFLVLKDEPGFEAAVARMRALVEVEAGKAAKAPSATPEQKKDAEDLAKLEAQLVKYQQGSGFSAAKRLLDAGRYAEAAAGFEKFADENRDNPDVPSAYYNAALAWEKAKEPKKALALRERILADYPDSKIAPQTVLAVAATKAREKDHAGAQKFYQSYLDRWPQAPQRCLALYNLGVEVESQGKKLEAAQKYKAFAADESCLKEDADNSARVLFHAGDLFLEAKKKDDAYAMWKAVAALTGVKDTVALSQVEEAKRRLKKAGK